MENSSQYEFITDNTSVNYTGGITFISDLHDNMGGLEETLRHAASKDNAVAILGDMMGYGTAEIAYELGVELPSIKHDKYLSEHMQPQDFQVYQVAKIIEQFGSRENAVDYFSQVNQGVNREQIEQEVDGIINYINNDEFISHIQELNQHFYQSQGEDYHRDVVATRTLERALKEIQLQKFGEAYHKVAEETGKKVAVYWLDGNHEEKGDAQGFRKYLGDDVTFVNLGEVEGFYTHKSANNSQYSSEDITIAGTPNIFQGIAKHKPEIYTPMELKERIPHMNDESLHNGLFGKGNISKDEIKSLEDTLFSQDREIQRIFNNGEETRDLDVFVTHGPWRVPMIDENRRGREDIFAISAAYLADKAKVSAQGHIHKAMAGHDDEGNFFVRPAGKMYDMYKVDGEMKVVDIPTEFNYESHKVVDFDKELLQEYMNYFYPEEAQNYIDAMNVMQQTYVAANEDIYEEEKLSA